MEEENLYHGTLELMKYLLVDYKKLSPDNSMNLMKGATFYNNESEINTQNEFYINIPLNNIRNFYEKADDGELKEFFFRDFKEYASINKLP